MVTRRLSEKPDITMEEKKAESRNVQRRESEHTRPPHFFSTNQEWIESYCSPGPDISHVRYAILACLLVFAAGTSGAWACNQRWEIGIQGPSPGPRSEGFLVLCQCAAVSFGIAACLCSCLLCCIKAQERCAPLWLMVAVDAIAGVTHLVIFLGDRITPVYVSQWGRWIVGIQYLEWVCTVPLMVLVACLVCLFQRRLSLPLATSQALCLAFGFLGSVFRGAWAYIVLLLCIFLALPFICFVILFLITPLKNFRASELKWARVVSSVLLGAWVLWPVVYLVGALDLVSRDVEAILFSTLDLLTKLTLTTVLIIMQLLPQKIQHDRFSIPGVMGSSMMQLHRPSSPRFDLNMA